MAEKTQSPTRVLLQDLDNISSFQINSSNINIDVRFYPVIDMCKNINYKYAYLIICYNYGLFYCTDSISILIPQYWFAYLRCASRSKWRRKKKASNLLKDQKSNKTQDSKHVYVFFFICLSLSPFVFTRFSFRFSLFFSFFSFLFFHLYIFFSLFTSPLLFSILLSCWNE